MTPKQKTAWVRNYTIFQLKGMIARLRTLQEEWCKQGVSPEWLYDLDVSIQIALERVKKMSVKKKGE